MTPAAIGFIVVLAATSGAADPRDQREVKLAEYAVFAAFAFGGESDRSANDACLNCCTASAELGVILLGSKNSPKALTALVALLRLPLDASLAEMHACFVLAKGKRILRPLRAVVPADLAQRCAEELSTADGTEPRLSGRTIDRVCARPADIEARRKELVDAILNGRKCPPEDF